MLLGGCNGGLSLGDPTEQAGTWMPTGDNDANLHAMVADPHDLVAGKPVPDTLAVEAAPPVGLLLSGKRLPLASPGGMSPGGGGSGASQGGGASMGGGSASAQ
ncbi:MAG TPA: hypothetical protein VFN46_06155 [Acetobacteraceae bacterium]|nr:hypothetical protein [Acetobacteraceae bacterium]